MPDLHRQRYLLPGLPGGVLLLAVMGGCSHTLEVDVPANVHGKVTVTCDSFNSSGPPIQVSDHGVAPRAVCPPSVQSLVVMGGGQPVRPANPPKWSTTGDGILLTFEFDLP